tara:strand:- start:8896 stop:9225 length:330 start_codon:yes stop_codon:yes gene_type:complete
VIEDGRIEIRLPCMRILPCLFAGVFTLNAAEYRHVRATTDEPLRDSLSLELAARSMDASALAWQADHDGSQCHANMMHLIARPKLTGVLPPRKEIRKLFEWRVNERWKK